MFDLKNKLKRTVALVGLFGLLFVSAPPASTLARSNGANPTQGVDAACLFNGSPLLPSGSGDVSWAVLANFNHTASTAVSKTCVVVRSYGVVSYTVGNFCVWANNKGAASAGGGTVTFDGVGYLHCDATIPAVKYTPEFRTHVNAVWPSKPTVATYNFALGADVNFSAQVDTTCLVTLNSSYDDIVFSHSTLKLCGSYNRYSSMMRQSITPNTIPAGMHRVQAGSSNTSYGPTADAGLFEMPDKLIVDIGKSSAGLTLDWILFDPGGECCAPK